MKLEEVIERLERDAKKPLACKEITLCDVDDLTRIINYIKEESIPRAVVEDRVEELKLIREEEEKTRFVLSFSIYNAITNEIDDLEEILNKGE